MNRSYYYFGIFILGVFVLTSLFQNMVYIQIGPSSFSLGTYLPMFYLTNVVNSLAVLVLLRYYWYRKFQFAYWTGLLSTVAAFGVSFIFYRMLTKAQFTDYYFPAYYIFLALSMLNALTLIFSDAGKCRWLKLTGIFSLGASVLVTVLITWFLSISDAQLRDTLDHVGRWVSPVINLIPVFIIMNFVAELRVLKEYNLKTSELEPFFATLMGLAGTILIITALMLGFKMNHEKRNFLKTVSYLEAGSGFADGTGAAKIRRKRSAVKEKCEWNKVG